MKIFNPSYDLKSPAASLRLAQSWVKVGGKDTDVALMILKKFCEENGFDFEAVENCLTALGWGGKYEWERALEKLVTTEGVA